MTTTLTVILVNYRSLANIEAQFASGVLDDHTVIVVDNGDDPDRVSQLCESHHATPLLLDRNIGFAAAINHAVATVQQPEQPWLLLNPDVSVDASQLSQLTGDLSEQVVGVAPLLADGNGQLQIGPGGGPLSLWAVATYFLFISRLFPRVRGVFLTRSQSRRTRDVSWLCMACLVLQPDAFARYGPIPEAELVYAEDVAWGTAASQRGARFELATDVVVQHDQGSSGSSARWIGAFTRLCRTRLGPVRGGLAVVVVRAGLAVRRLLGRRVT